MKLIIPPIKNEKFLPEFYMSGVLFTIIFILRRVNQILNLINSTKFFRLTLPKINSFTFITSKLFRFPHNKTAKIILISFVILLSANISHAASRLTRSSYDIIIAGAGTGGISAAIQAARMGASVLVVEPSTWIGGQATAAGVSTMDDMSRQKSGIYLEFINRIKSYYDARGKSMGTCYWHSQSVAFEPHIGQEALISMVNDAKRRGTLDFLMSSEVVAVQKQGRIISGVTVKAPSGTKNFSCKVLIDATEYGDVLPLAKTLYRAGNSSGRFIDKDAMIQEITWTAIIRDYGGSIPIHLRVRTPLPGYELAKKNYESYVSRDGFNFRNVYPIELPVNFMTHNAYRGLPDSSNHLQYDAGPETRRYITKTSVNWGNDYPGTYTWNGKRGLPVSYLEDKKVRLQIEREALIKTLHFIYYVQHELGENWSVAHDEYNNQILPEAAKGLPYEWQEIIKRMPPIPYVRESRRIVGKHTLTSHEILRNSLSYRDGQTSHEFSDAIAIGGYILDLHGGANDGNLEWDFGEKTSSQVTNRPRGPFQVPMDILIPEDTDGLLAAEKNLSMTRLSAGALRLQPITMMTGQAAGALAAISALDNKPPREIHPLRVQWALLNSGVNLSLCNYSDVPPAHSLNKSIQLSNLYGLVAPDEYPHAPSYNIEDLDDPVLAMAIIRGHDKGRFGVDDILTKPQAAEIILKSQRAIGLTSVINPAKVNGLLSRGELAKLVYDEFPMLKNIERPKNTRLPFKIGKHKNSEYVETLAWLGILNIYKIENEFNYSKPVTKGEAVDVIVRAAIAAAGMK